MHFIMPVVAVLPWVAFVVFTYRRFRFLNMKERENALGHQLQSAAWSDRYVESLLERHPASPVLLRQYVANARDRQDWPEALRRSGLFVERVRSPEARLIHADVLRRAGRGEEADALVERLRRRRPFNAEVIVHWARLPQGRADWARSARRFAVLRLHAPGRPEGYNEGANALIRAGKRAEAEAVISRGLRRCPDAYWIAHTAASLADEATDPEAGVAAWAAVRERFPSDVHGFIRGAAALVRAGREAEADQLLIAGSGLLPGNAEIAKAIAQRREKACV